MKIEPNTNLTFYKFAFTGSNVFDFQYEGSEVGFYFEFKRKIDSIFSTNSFQVSTTRAIQIENYSATFVIPMDVEKVKDFNFVAIPFVTGGGGTPRYYFFDVISTSSLYNGIDATTSVTIQMNLYYSYLYDLQKAFVSAPVVYSRHHVARYNLRNGQARIVDGLECALDVTFNDTITDLSTIQPSLLWMYVTFDEDTIFDVDYPFGSKYHQNVKIEWDGSHPYGMGRRVVAYPIGFFDKGLIYPISNMYQGNEAEQATFVIKPIKIVSFQHIIDAYITNAPPPFHFTYDFPTKSVTITTDNTIANYAVEVYELNIPREKLCVEGLGFTCGQVSSSLSSTDQTPDPTALSCGGFDYSFSFTRTEKPLSTVKPYLSGRVTDPAFELAPFTSLSTIDGEIFYSPIRTEETFEAHSYCYYRSMNVQATNSNETFYLDFWKNFNGFVFGSTDKADTFYRNNGSQYTVKMNTQRINAACQMVGGALDVIAGNYYSNTFGVTKTPIYGPARDAKGRFTGGVAKVGQRLEENEMAQYVGSQKAYSGAAGVINGAVNFFSSLAMEQALKTDLAKAQDDYTNVTSSNYPNCQMLVFYKKIPLKTSLAFNIIADDLYEFGYRRQERGYLGERNRTIYDYKQVSVFRSILSTNPDVNSFVENLFASGVTVWHLDNINTTHLTQAQITQIINTCSKSLIANYEPWLDG